MYYDDDYRVRTEHDWLIEASELVVAPIPGIVPRVLVVSLNKDRAVVLAWEEMPGYEPTDLQLTFNGERLAVGGDLEAFKELFEQAYTRREAHKVESLMAGYDS